MQHPLGAEKEIDVGLCASSRGGEKSLSASSRSSSSQGGTTAQKKAAGGKGGKATARKSWRARVSIDDDVIILMRSANDKHSVCRLHCVVFG
jgi:hypothetical protein